MIKYTIIVADKAAFTLAQDYKDSFSLILSGMRCANCSVDTDIFFVQESGKEHIRPIIKACCDGFEQSINED
jgi:hypothetical protein